MKLKKLENLLNDVEIIDSPKLSLEQYNTSPHIVAQIVHTIHTRYDDLSNKLLCDFGTGSGIFAISATLLSDCRCIGIEIDDDALKICQQNINEFGLESKIDIIKANVLELDNIFVCQNIHGGIKKPFDITIMNPPFGTKNNWGMDMKFLSMACKLTSHAVYSLHKTSTREHIQKVMSNQGMKCQVLAQIHFDIPSSYNFHKKESQDVEVDLIRLTHTA